MAKKDNYPLTKEMLSDDQFKKLVYFFHKHWESVHAGAAEINKLNFIQRKIVQKHVKSVNEFYEELENL